MIRFQPSDHHHVSHHLVDQIQDVKWSAAIQLVRVWKISLELLQIVAQNAF